MDIDINISVLSDKDKATVKALGHLAKAWIEASHAESTLIGEFKYSFEDEVSAIHNATIALKFVRAGLTLQVESIALEHGAGHGDYTCFVDEGEAVVFVYVQ